jgi:hypothetical protein
MSQADPLTGGIARPRPARSTAAAERLSILVVLFLIAMMFPLYIYLGPLRLTTYRIALLLCLIPCFVRWLSGGAGPIRLADVCMILIGFWVVVSYAVLDGISVAIESGGIKVVETLGAYFLGRCFIRSPETFRRMAVLLFWIIIGLLPFVIHEMLTGRNTILTSINSLGQTYEILSGYYEPRLGLERAQGPFPHPILLGVFCGSTVSLTYYVVARGRGPIVRALRTFAVVLAAFCALSSGPLAGIAAQFLMIGWDKVLQRYPRRWWVLGGLITFCYVVVDLISNRSALIAVVSRFALDTATAYARVYIFEFGWRDVWENHPVFGLGLSGDAWERPEWMSASVDMFWLKQTMLHGLPAGALYHLAFILIVVAVVRRKLSDPRLQDYRMGYLGGMAGFYITGWAVDFWNEPYVLLMFMMGSGVWLLDHDETPPETPPAAKPARRRTVLG